jgi:hypothetical protein
MGVLILLERERQTDRQTDRQTLRERDRERARDREGGSDRGGGSDRERDAHATTYLASTYKYISGVSIHHHTSAYATINLEIY